MSTSAASALDVFIDLQPKQDDLWNLVDESDFTDIGYGGRRGGGKSGGMRRILILRRLKYAATDGVLLRRYYNDLRDNHIVTLFREFPFMQDWWLEKEKALYFPNGSRLLFRFAEHQKDVGRLFGVEYADICAEEAGEFTETELQMMKGSNRWPGTSGITPKMLYSFMPGGRSHVYLKRVFVDRAFTADEDPSRFVFLEAYGWDNVEWVRKALSEDFPQVAEDIRIESFYRWDAETRKQYFLGRADYAKTLLSITNLELRKAWLDGDWNRFEGSVFPELRDDLHNLDRFKPNFMGFDHSKNVSAVDWADTGLTAATQSNIDVNEFMYVLDEYAQLGDGANHDSLISQHTAAILGMLRKYGEQSYTLMDLPTTNINQKDLLSIQYEFQKAGLRTAAAQRSHVEMGINLLKELLRIDPTLRHPFTGELGSPRLFMSRARCPVAWKQMTEFQRIINSNGKVEYVGRHDAIDTIRYVAMSRPRAPKKPERVVMNERLAKIPEMTAKHMEHLRLKDLAAKRNRPIQRPTRGGR